MNYTAKMKKVKGKIIGKDKLLRKLKAMDQVASNILMAAAKEGGAIALSKAKQDCPVDTGALRDSLKMTENIKKPKKADVKIDYDKSLKYGTHVELGARGRAANPFMREAVDNNIDKINEVITESISKAVRRKM